MRIWMPPVKMAGGRTVLAALAIVALAMLLAAACGILGAVHGWPAQAQALAVCAVTLLCVLLSFALARRSHISAVIFCRDCERRLYCLDLSMRTRYRRGPAGFAAMQAELARRIAECAAPEGELAARLAVPGAMRGFADEILSVEKMSEGRGELRLRARVRRANGSEGSVKLAAQRGFEGEDELILELERRQNTCNF